MRYDFLTQFGVSRFVTTLLGVATVGLVCGSLIAADDGAEVADSPKVANKAVADNKPAEPGAAKVANHPLTPAIEIAKEARDAIAKVKDYEAAFARKELVKGTMYTSQMTIKHRHEPFSVYLRFFGPNDGREVLYVHGKNQGNMLAHEGSGIKSLAGTLSLQPTSARAMSEGRYPITEIGMLKMVEALIRQWEQETQYGETEVQYFPNAQIGEMSCKAVVTSHPLPRKQFRFHKSVIYLDKETNFPVHLEQWGFPPREGADPVLVEEYTYSKIKTDVGLKDMDFDRRNTKYRF